MQQQQQVALEGGSTTATTGLVRCSSGSGSTGSMLQVGGSASAATSTAASPAHRQPLSLSPVTNANHNKTNLMELSSPGTAMGKVFWDNDLSLHTYTTHANCPWINQDFFQRRDRIDKKAA